MQAISYLKSEIIGTNLYDLNLEEFNQNQYQTSSEYLIYGYRILEKGGLSNSKKPGVYKYLNVTMPTEYCQIEFVRDRASSFSEVYGICPYSVVWLNYLESSTRFKYIYYPVSIPSQLDPFSPKPYDIIYHGGIHSEKYLYMLKYISMFDYRYATMTQGINQLTQHAAKQFGTDLNLTPYAKYELLAKCKLSVTFNNFPLSTQHILNIQQKPEWQRNFAFSRLDSYIAPQFKSRVNEAAALGVINLVENDHWNVIENFYTPDIDFIYFNSVEELPDLISTVLSNYDNYYEMRKSAYYKSKRYCRRNLFDDIQASRSWPNLHTCNHPLVL